MPPNASEKQKKASEKAMEEYKIQRESYTYNYTNDKGEVVEVIVIPENDGRIPPPPPPVSPLEHIEEMSKKGALFFYNDKSISEEEAINYVKNNKKLYISTKQVDTEQPKVYISTKPVRLEN